MKALIPLLLLLAVAFSQNIPTFSPASDVFNATEFSNWIISKAGAKELRVKPGTYSVVASIYRGGGIFPLFIYNVQDLTVSFDDVTLIFTDWTKGGLVLDNCTNVVIRGLTSTYSIPTSSQAKVVNITQVPNNTNRYWVDMQVVPGFLSRFFWGEPGVPGYGYVFNGTTLQPYQPSYETQLANLQTTQSLSSDNTTFRWLIAARQINNKLVVGDYVAVRGFFSQLYNTNRCTNISFIDITVYQCGGLAWSNLGGDGGHLYQRIAIRYGPPPIPNGMTPLITCSADGIHFIGAKRGPTVIDSLFEGMQDDGINLKGIFANVSAIRGNVYDMLYSGQSTSPTWVVGDRLRLYNSRYAPYGYATIVNITFIAGRNWNPSVALDVTSAVRDLISVGDIITNLDRQNRGFLIKNNTFRVHRARAMMVKASDGIISHNIINSTSLGGILINPERAVFVEADYSQNLIIENNSIYNAGFFAEAGSIAVFVTSNSGIIPDAGGFVNITIRNNLIVSSVRDNIKVQSGVNISIYNNTIVGPLSMNYPAVDLYNVANALVDDNCVMNATSASAVLIRTNGTFSGQINGGVTFCNGPIPVFPPSPWDPQPTSSTSSSTSGSIRPSDTQTSTPTIIEESDAIVLLPLAMAAMIMLLIM
eukprot:TRINITY_DN2566_c0_g1_i2.p1 TRINITY_DN2566_c0_g1~~TRINITY_DN2566_c0_g1_i2.p1  ORF type:complete len:646 (-),score=143.48 TRINITY_DN2566_c0_g1_i2:68-2005(-)